MTQTAILILAAGASSRMGGVDKLLQQAGGTPLLTRVIRRARATGFATYVTVPDLTHPRSRLALDCGAMLVAVPDWASGMAASIRAGVAALPASTRAVMILPGDMPDLQSDDLKNLAQAAHKAPGAILRATTPQGIPGHPVIFPAGLFVELQGITGDQGARSVLDAHCDRVRPHVLPANRAICDLDTPADWIAWKAAQGVDEQH